MSGNRFGHRLALNLVGGRAVIFMENWKNDGGLLLAICESKSNQYLCACCTRLLFIIKDRLVLLCRSRMRCWLFSSLFFSYRPRRVDFALLFTACAKSTWLLQILIDRKMSLKLDLNQLTNLNHKIIKIILFITFKIKCQK